MPKKVSKRLPAPKPKGQRSSRSTQKKRVQHGGEGEPGAQLLPRALAAQGTPPLATTLDQPRREGSPDVSPQQSTSSDALIRKLVRALFAGEHESHYAPDKPKIQTAALQLATHLHEAVYRWLFARWAPDCEACKAGTCDNPEHMSEEDLLELVAMSEPDPRLAAIRKVWRDRLHPEQPLMRRIEGILSFVEDPDNRRQAEGMISRLIKKPGKKPGSKNKAAEKDRRAAEKRFQDLLERDPNATFDEQLEAIMYNGHKKIRNTSMSKPKEVYTCLLYTSPSPRD